MQDLLRDVYKIPAEFSGPLQMQSETLGDLFPPGTELYVHEDDSIVITPHGHAWFTHAQLLEDGRVIQLYSSWPPAYEV